MHDVIRKKPDPVDIHVGERVRMRRKMMSMSQTELGKQLGVTFQQVQKYERGTNRIGSSRLFRTCSALDVTVGWLFEGAETKLPGYDPDFDEVDDNTYDKPESKELLGAYYNITDPRIRKKIIAIAKLLSSNNDFSI